MVCIEGFMNSLKTINVSLFYNNAVAINFKKYCRGVIFSKGGPENSSRNEWSQSIASLFLERYTCWAASLFAWDWLLALAWLLGLAREARRMWSSDSEASAGSLSETLFPYCIFDLIIFFFIRIKTWKIWLISIEHKVYRIINIVILFHFHR